MFGNSSPAAHEINARSLRRERESVVTAVREEGTTLYKSPLRRLRDRIVNALALRNRLGTSDIRIVEIDGYPVRSSPKDFFSLSKVDRPRDARGRRASCARQLNIAGLSARRSAPGSEASPSSDSTSRVSRQTIPGHFRYRGISGEVSVLD